MSKRLINGTDLTAMVLSGAECLRQNVERINALNVFPVPDGDTGTNMNMTMNAGTKELLSKPSTAAGKVAEALSKGLLMGARGNSGVILSQLFRGFAKSMASLEQADTMQFASALQSGVDMAYKAVVKPVEGTILSVAREAAKHAQQVARRTSDMTSFMLEVHSKALEALQRTPEQLPVLKQVGVVDSGGQGLVCIYEGFLRALTESAGEERSRQQDDAAVPSAAGAAAGTAVSFPEQAKQSAQSRLATDAITFLYDMEFRIDRKLAGRFAPKFDEEAFKRQLARDGDSILVIADEEVIKVHVHSRKPGDVLNYAMPYGELTDFHILNMREQHRGLIGREPVSAAPGGGDAVILAADTTAAVEAAALGMAVPEVLTGTPADAVPTVQAHEMAPYGIIAVALGEGLGSIFLENNVDIVLSGGQTMNPSTEDFVNAIEQLPAEHIYVLPNNGNIIMSAKQAAELCGRNVTVIPTKTIPQGLAAALAFKDEESAEANAEAMAGAAALVRSGQVTCAVRDSAIDGIEIKEGDYIGILEKTIVCSSSSLQDACRELLTVMLEDGAELVTILKGGEADESQTGLLLSWAQETFPEAEFEVHDGGQPLYPYLFAAE